MQNQALLGQDQSLLALLILLATFVCASMIVHWFVVCRVLYKHGSRFPTGFVFWRTFHELRLYKKLRSAQGRSPTIYYVAFILSWFDLLLLFGIVIRIFWNATHPMG
jgi:hypothetical protein